MLAGVLNGEPILLTLLFTFGGLRLAWSYRRERQIKSALEAQRKLAEGSSAPESRKRLAWMSS